MIKQSLRNGGFAHFGTLLNGRAHLQHSLHMPTFVAIDVETANADCASICQIGMAHFEAGQLVDQWVSLVDPCAAFRADNTRIHGICASAVRGQPTFAVIHSHLLQRLSGAIVVSHTSFDYTAIDRASQLHGLPMPTCTWLDSAKVARRVWPEVARHGYGLANLAARLGVQFRHHDALHDAIAAGQVLLHALAHSGQDLDWWLRRVRRGIVSQSGADKAATAVLPTLR